MITLEELLRWMAETGAQLSVDSSDSILTIHLCKRVPGRFVKTGLVSKETFVLRQVLAKDDALTAVVEQLVDSVHEGCWEKPDEPISVRAAE